MHGAHLFSLRVLARRKSGSGAHWTSTVPEERVVMIVLGSTTTLDLWEGVGTRVRGAEGLGGLA